MQWLYTESSCMGIAAMNINWTAVTPGQQRALCMMHFDRKFGGWQFQPVAYTCRLVSSCTIRARNTTHETRQYLYIKFDGIATARRWPSFLQPCSHRFGRNAVAGACVAVTRDCDAGCTRPDPWGRARVGRHPDISGYGVAPYAWWRCCFCSG